MVFRRKKHKNTAEESIDFHALVLEQLEHMCEEGQILDDAFVLEAQDIYIYADVVSVFSSTMNGWMMPFWNL